MRDPRLKAREVSINFSAPFQLCLWSLLSALGLVLYTYFRVAFCRPLRLTGILFTPYWKQKASHSYFKAHFSRGRAVIQYSNQKQPGSPGSCSLSSWHQEHFLVGNHSFLASIYRWHSPPPSPVMSVKLAPIPTTHAQSQFPDHLALNHPRTKSLFYFSPCLV